MIKVIENFNKGAFEEEVNQFEKDYIVFATQTHIVKENVGYKYVAVVFHKGSRKLD